jgi:hypothetical protein
MHYGVIAPEQIAPNNSGFGCGVLPHLRNVAANQERYR